MAPIFWYNQRWYDYTGTTAAAMEGWGWQSVHDPIELPSALRRWRECIATGEPFEMVFPLRAANGTFSSYLTRVVPITRRGEGRRVRLHRAFLQSKTPALDDRIFKSYEV